MNDKLTFADIVKTYFDRFLLQNSFRCVIEDKSVVRYEHGDYYIEFCRDARSFEIDFVVGQKSINSSFYLSEMLAVADPLFAKTFRLYVAKTPEAINKGTEQLFEIFTKYCMKFLLEAESFMQQLAKQKGDNAARYGLEIRLEQIRTKIESASAKRDYPELVRLYESIDDHLTNSEKAKYKFAKKKLLQLRKN